MAATRAWRPPRDDGNRSLDVNLCLAAAKHEASIQLQGLPAFSVELSAVPTSCTATRNPVLHMAGYKAELLHNQIIIPFSCCKVYILSVLTCGKRGSNSRIGMPRLWIQELNRGGQEAVPTQGHVRYHHKQMC